MKIKHQQAGLFLILALILIFSLTLVVYYNQKKVIIKNVEDHLESISETKEIRMKEMIKKKMELIDLVSGSYSLTYNLKAFTNSREEDKRDKLNAELKYLKNTVESFYELHLVGMNGELIASSDPNTKTGAFNNDESFLIARTGYRYLNALHFDKKQRLTVTLAAPVTVKKKQLGVLITQFHSQDVVSLTSDYTGLGNTGETTLAKKNGKVIFLTGLRYDSAAALRRELPLEDTTFGMSKLLTSYEPQFGITKDYRGKDVLASTRYIPETGWGMITKIDLEEVMQPVNSLRNLLLVFGLLSIPVALALSVIAARSLSHPLKTLIGSTNRIKNGDLKYRITNYPNNEMGELAVSFNEMTDQLEKKMSELDRFAYVVSHDLKAPVHSIIPLISMVKDEYKGRILEGEGLTMLTMAQEKAESMEKMISDILKFAKEERVKEKINSGEIVTEVLTNINVPDSINITVAKNLPVIVYPKTSIIQVFQNLLGNAVKYMDKNQGKISVSWEENEESFCFCIKDNGPGIPEEDQEKVFGMFTSTSKKNVESTGIGLSVVKSIVEENGGSIRLESEPGKGCRFYFTVPK